MTPASLIGFAVVFVLVCLGTSVLGYAATRAGRASLARRGPAAERRAVELAATAPLAAGVAVVAVLVLQSWLGPDHCPAHHHHLHLCLWHGAAWAEHVWPVALLAVAVATAGARLVAVIAANARGARRVRQLRGVAKVDAGVHLVASDRAFCFVAGFLRPRVYASTAVRAALTDDEWRAMLAHEASHVRHRDLLTRLGLELRLAFAAPHLGRALLERWDDATERLRDADAAEAVGSPETVASALLRMCRLASAPFARVASFAPRGDRTLDARVTSLLSASERGEGAARAMRRWVVGAGAALFAAGLALADPLHHALETLLG
jgi:hypothetical protein